MEKLFNDSLGDFRIDPPKEEKKRLFIKVTFINALFFLKKYSKISIFIGATIAITTISLWLNNANEQGEKHGEKQRKKAQELTLPAVPQNTNTKNLNISNDKKQLSFSTKKQTNNPLKTKNNQINKKLFSSTKENTINISLNSKKKKSRLNVINSKKKTNILITTNTLNKNKIETIKKKEKDKDKKKENLQNKNTEELNLENYTSENPSLKVKNNSSEENLKIDKTTEQEQEFTTKNQSNNPDSIKEKNDKILVNTDSIKTNNLDTTSEKTIKTKKLKYTIGLSSSYNDWLINQADNYKISPFYHVGIDAGIVFKNWILQTGIQYKNQTIKTSSPSLFTSTEPVYNTIQSIQLDTIFGNWDTTSFTIDTTLTETIDTSYSSNTIYSDKKQTLKLSYLCIPIFLGKNFEFKKHQLGILAGLGINILNKQSSSINYIVDSSLKFIAKSYYLDYKLRLHYGFYLTSNFLINIDLQLIRNAKNPLINNSNNPQIGIGGLLGLSWVF